MKSKLSNGQVVGIGLAISAVLKSMLPRILGDLAGFVLLNVMFLICVGAVKC